MTTAAKRTRGFFFTVLALILLSFMLLAVQAWVQTFEQSDQRAAERFKGEAVRTVLSSLSDEGISSLANASAFYAAYKLANYSSFVGIAPDCPSASDPENPCTANVERYAKELMMNGSTQNVVPGIAYSEAENNSYTIGSWRDRVASSASMLGFNVTFSEPENFVFRQESPWTANVGFELGMNISDFEKTVWQAKKLKANATFSLTGFADPMVARGESAGPPHDIVAKQVWKHDNYGQPSNVAPALLAGDGAPGAGVEGNGWFFGPFTSDLPGQEGGIFEQGSPEVDRIKQYILVSDMGNNVSSVSGLYGAIILTSPPSDISLGVSSGGCDYNITAQVNCLNCLRRFTSNWPGCLGYSEIYENETDVPVIVATGMGLSGTRPPTVYREGMGAQAAQQFLLIDNEYYDAERKAEPGAYHNVWDITLLRDMAICGFYVHDQTAPSPSFFQRMLSGAPSDGRLVSADYGIESFVVGRWAGGSLDCTRTPCDQDSYSRLDWEFYNSNRPANSYRIKGMMGCKNATMCTGPEATLNATGKFRLSLNASERFGAKEIIFIEGNPAPIPVD